MAYLIATELSTHLYQELANAINRNDVGTYDTAITAAIAEAKGYLNKFDTAAIFSATGDSRNPILLLYVKDIAVWHFITLAPANVDTEYRMLRYEKAIKWLSDVQKGNIVPDLPYPAPSTDDPQLNSTVRYGNARTRTVGNL